MKISCFDEFIFKTREEGTQCSIRKLLLKLFPLVAASKVLLCNKMILEDSSKMQFHLPDIYFQSIYLTMSFYLIRFIDSSNIFYLFMLRKKKNKKNIVLHNKLRSNGNINIK